MASQRCAWWVGVCGAALAIPLGDEGQYVFAHHDAVSAIGLLARGLPLCHLDPWVIYPRDLGHNFVLAHKSCNLDKSDLLAATTHLV